MTPQPEPIAVLFREIERIAKSVAREHAASVDREARFPRETFDALREVGALSAAVQSEQGGAGASLAALSRMCRLLGAECAASGMILAMHHIQVLCLERHRGDDPAFRAYAERLVREQRLIASVTSEVGPSGNLRESVCAVETTPEGIALRKQATTISYGAHADDLLVTARRAPDAAGNDQVLVLLLDGQYALESPGKWDTLGMRGTCSPGALVVGKGEAWQVLGTPFDAVASQTMVPTSHMLWASSWLGLSEGALSIAARRVRELARKTPGRTPSSARALERASRLHETFQAQVVAAARDFDERSAVGDPALFSQLGFVLAVNTLKLNASVAVVDIVTECLRCVGIGAYRLDSPLALGRQLRDAHSAALMINNDRLEDTNQSLLLVHKGI